MLKKQLGLKKQKSKNLPKAFSDDESSSKRFKMDNINDSSDNSGEDDNLANEVLGNKDESHESEMSEDEKEEDEEQRNKRDKNGNTTTVDSKKLFRLDSRDINGETALHVCAREGFLPP